MSSPKSALSPSPHASAAHSLQSTPQGGSGPESGLEPESVAALQLSRELEFTVAAVHAGETTEFEHSVTEDELRAGGVGRKTPTLKYCFVIIISVQCCWHKGHVPPPRISISSVAYGPHSFQALN